MINKDPTQRIFDALSRTWQAQTAESGEVLSVYLDASDLAEIYTQALRARLHIQPLEAQAALRT